MHESHHSVRCGILARMEFRATLQLLGKTATGFEVPPEVIEQLGAGKRPPVSVTINGFMFRTTIAPMRGCFLLGVNAEYRRAAQLTAGDEVDIALELDTAPREVTVPDDLAAALAAAPDAMASYDKLSYTHRKEWVRWVEEAKRPETRTTRVAKTVEELRAGKRTH
jgi:hypothetical protein